jgi:cytoskeletal protein CcmA (bactofilin family)
MGKAKLEAGILSSVLAISLIIATLCASLISLAYYYHIATLQYTLTDALDQNALSGMNLLLATPSDLISPYGYWKDLFGQTQDSVWLQEKPWGVYQVAIARAKKGNRSRQRVALLGQQPDQIGQSALYLADEQRPLSIAGQTQLIGRCYLPKAGIKSAYINRVGYQGEQLVKGSIQESQGSLPKLSPDVVAHLRRLLTVKAENYLSLDQLGDSLVYSFEAAPTYYHSPGPITISGLLRGNIIIASDRAVTITPQADVEDIIVVAPQITIAPDFEGRLQAIATDTLIVGRGCQLRYPSALVLFASSGGAVLIDEASQVAGTVVLTGTATAYHRRLLSLEKEASITGMVYSDGLVELKGSIYGHLSCRKFMLRTPSTLYENHILDGTLDASRRSSHYLASSLWATTHQKGIAQWLY